MWKLGRRKVNKWLDWTVQIDLNDGMKGLVHVHAPTEVAACSKLADSHISPQTRQSAADVQRYWQDMDPPQ